MPTAFRRLIEEGFLLYALAIFTGAYVNMPVRLSSASIEMGASNPYNTFAIASIVCGIVVFGGTEWRSMLAIANRVRLIQLFIALAVLSSIWSYDPATTVRRTITLSVSVLFAYYAVMRVPMAGLIRRLAIVSVASALLSIATAVALPSVGVMSLGNLAGDWNGVFTHKQELGWNMFLGILSLVWLIGHEKGSSRWLSCAGVGFCLVCLVNAKSQTATLSVLMLPVTMSLAGIAKLPGLARMWAAFALAAVVIPVLVMMTLDLDSIMTVIGRDMTLTGRVPLWELLMAQGAERPITGFGYGAFWLETNPTARYVRDVVGWPAPEAHNAYIDLFIQVGIPGAVLGTGVLFGIVRQAFLACEERVPWASFALCYTVTLLVTNMVETMLLRPGDVQCMMIPLVYASLRTRGMPGIRRAPSDGLARSGAAQIPATR